VRPANRSAQKLEIGPHPWDTVGVLVGRKRGSILIATLVLAGMGAASVVALPATSHPVAHRSPPSATGVRTPRGTDWQSIQGAVSLRHDALRPHLTAFHRAFAAYMGLSALVQLRHRLRGRCAVAVSYLYDNLLDLHDAYTGEDWMPLRHAVATQPSLQVCAPAPPRQGPQVHSRYVE
jgi:hypothetical protein